MSNVVRVIEGHFSQGSEAHIALVASRFNHFIVDRLIEGATDGLVRHGVKREHITLVHTPGAFELPLIAQRLAKSGKVQAVIALGAVIRGSTPHFDLIAAEVSKGCAQAMLDTNIPVIFGVLTTDTLEQAIERAGTKAGNKGWEAALSALEMVHLGQNLSAHGF